MDPKIKALWYSLYEPYRLGRERAKEENKFLHMSASLGLKKMISQHSSREIEDPKKDPAQWMKKIESDFKKDLEEFKLGNPNLNHRFLLLIPDPLISVYCPTFNRADILLGRALPSVCSQTYRNFEFIIVDDCSTDDTESKVYAWCLKNNEKRVRVVRTKSRKKRYPESRMNHWFAGPVIPANLGLKECKGSWIARIDDDDVWTEDHLEKLLGFAIKENAEFVSSGYNITPRLISRNEFGEVGQDFYHGIGGDEWHGGTSSYFYRSYLKFFRYNIDCWRKDHNQVNDLDLCERLRYAGVRMAFLDEPTFTISPRPGETEIGAKAYRNGNDILEKYKF